MATIINMPGVNCELYAHGRCLYQEMLNPGLDPALRCEVLVSWMEEFDSFVNQADRFGLDEATATAIWERRLTELVRRGPECKDFKYAAYCEWPGSCDWPCQGEACDAKDSPSNGEGEGESPATARVSFACAHSRDDVCLLRLPRCKGVCDQFRLASPTARDKEKNTTINP